jgi:hypothetical protein
MAYRLNVGAHPRSILHVPVEGRTAQDVADVIRRGATTWPQGPPGKRPCVIDEITGEDGPWPA